MPDRYLLVYGDTTNVGDATHTRYEPVVRRHLIIVPPEIIEAFKEEKP